MSSIANKILFHLADRMLNEQPNRICDACLKRKLEIKHHQTVNAVCRKLERAGKIRRRKDCFCSDCEEDNICNELIAASLKGILYYKLPTRSNAPTIIVPVVQDDDDFWRQLKEQLACEARFPLMIGKPAEIIFLGGGTIPIPDWFRGWCEKNGIEITILRPEKGGNFYPCPRGGYIIIPFPQNDSRIWDALRMYIENEIGWAGKETELPHPLTLFVGENFDSIPDWFKELRKSRGHKIVILSPEYFFWSFLHSNLEEIVANKELYPTCYRLAYRMNPNIVMSAETPADPSHQLDCILDLL